MLWWIFLFVFIFFIGAIFYKQSIQEFRINQIEWGQIGQIHELWEERAPIVVKGVPVPPVWTFQDVGIRPVYNIEIPKSQTKQTVQTWVGAAEPDAIVPWGTDTAARLAEIASFKPWLQAIWVSKYNRGLRAALSPLFPTVPYLWAGARGLHQVRSQWSLIFPTEGSIVVTLITSGQDDFLPKPWEGTFPSIYSLSDTPYVSSIQYMDVILRPGHALWVPAHWKVAWEPTDDTLKVGVPFVCTLDIHTPWSWLATQAWIRATAPPPPQRPKRRRKATTAKDK
jgi:hypothetical protein